jgi:hypothetical protein
LIVYMLLNTVTEMAYVGATGKALEQRWRGHVNSAKHGSPYPLHQAIREWPTDELCPLRRILVEARSV